VWIELPDVHQAWPFHGDTFALGSFFWRSSPHPLRWRAYSKDDGLPDGLN
jgi:hypothetical protein